MVFLIFSPGNSRLSSWSCWIPPWWCCHQIWWEACSKHQGGMFDSLFLLGWVLWRRFVRCIFAAVKHYTAKYLRAATLSTQWFVKMMLVVSDWFLYLLVEINLGKSKFHYNFWCVVVLLCADVPYNSWMHGRSLKLWETELANPWR
jgi:hypothetical protein